MESVLLYGVEVWGDCIVGSGHLNRYRSEQPGLWGGGIDWAKTPNSGFAI